MPKFFRKSRHKVASIFPAKLTVKLGVLSQSENSIINVDGGLLRAYFDLFDKIDRPVWMGNAKGETIYCNPAFTKMTGYERQEIMGVQELDFWADGSHEKVSHANRTHRKNGLSSTYEADILAKDGRVIPVRLTGTPLSNGGTHVILTDLSDVKSKEQMLSQRVNELNLISSIHEHTRMITAPKKVFADVVADIRKSSQDPAHTHVTLEFDGRATRSSLVRTYIACSLRAPLIVKGKVRGRIELGYSKRAKYLDRLLKEDQRLLDRVAETLSRHLESREIVEANKKLKSLNSLKDDFLAITSHELRSPLTSIRGYLSLLIDEASRENIPYEMKHYLLKAYHSSNTLSNLMNNILDVARLNTGRFDLHLAPVDVVQVMHGVVDQMEIQAAENGVELEFTNGHGAAELVTRADEVRLGQVLRNVIGNAIKFSPEKSRVEISLKKVHPNIVIEVSDHGMGIEKKDLEKVFDKFIQAEGGAHYSSGAGLGLYISKQIIEHHGGEISLKSKPKEGTKVTIKLPIR